MVPAVTNSAATGSVLDIVFSISSALRRISELREGILMSDVDSDLNTENPAPAIPASSILLPTHDDPEQTEDDIQEEKDAPKWDEDAYVEEELLEVLEEDGTWEAAVCYRHRSTGDVCLWFGDDKYEGLGGGYRREVGVYKILDADGDTIEVIRIFTAPFSARDSVHAL